MFKGLEGLSRMIGSADDGVGEIELEFAVGTDMDKSLVLVANRLDRVPDQPNDAAEPIISSAGSEDQPIAWFILSRNPATSARSTPTAICGGRDPGAASSGCRAWHG